MSTNTQNNTTPNKKWPDGSMLEAAWGIIANAHGGDWDIASPEWKKAAEKWRDTYCKLQPAEAPNE